MAHSCLLERKYFRFLVDSSAETGRYSTQMAFILGKETLRDKKPSVLIVEYWVILDEFS